MAAEDDPTSHANPLWGVKGSWDPVNQVVLPPEQRLHPGQPMFQDGAKLFGAAPETHGGEKPAALSLTTHEAKGAEWHQDSHGDWIFGSAADGWLFT